MYFKNRSMPANLVVRLVHVENIAVYLITGVIAVHLAVTSERYIVMGTHDLAATMTGPCLPVFHVDAASILAAGMGSESESVVTESLWLCICIVFV